MDSTDTTQAVEDVSRDKTHATTPSFGSSMLSFHTVQSSTDTPRKTLLHLEESFDVEELIDEGRATPQQTIDLKEDKSIEDVSTPTPTSSAFDTQTPNTGLPDLECEDGHSGDSEEEEEEKVLGHAIKSLPNGMTSLPSPSVGSRSFDCSSSPFSRPLALVSLAPTEESRRRSLRPIVYTPPTTTNTVAADSSSSGDSASSTNPTRPSTSSSAATTHPTASPHHNHTRKKKDKEIESEWGAQFWTLITDPSNPRNTFFANPATGECKWELPKGTIVLPPRDEGEWWELYDEERKGEYYWHTKTEECRWDRPDLLVLVNPDSTLDSSSIQRGLELELFLSSQPRATSLRSTNTSEPQLTLPSFELDPARLSDPTSQRELKATQFLRDEWLISAGQKEPDNLVDNYVPFMRNGRPESTRQPSRKRGRSSLLDQINVICSPSSSGLSVQAS
ncbi:uncharacterized protein UBRO2_05783 [Ustilago bromivora]|uniref:WW domain-containing protein n=1 Tax=Ustilago bromivora TaxID=307758 RepID=A0A8H8QUT5_9BASI|nr:uncharacterized protein UBRO2_05783 [Ustilago bromivora]